MNTFWLSAISVICTSTLIGLGLLLNMLFSWRKDLREDMASLKNSLDQKIADLCDDKEKTHGELWKRINHHAHNPNGRVVITETD